VKIVWLHPKLIVITFLAGFLFLGLTSIHTSINANGQELRGTPLVYYQSGAPPCPKGVDCLCYPDNCGLPTAFSVSKFVGDIIIWQVVTGIFVFGFYTLREIATKK
jgi:hypothetical protein